MNNIPPDEDRELDRQEKHNEAVEAQVDTLAESMITELNEVTVIFSDYCEEFAEVYIKHDKYSLARIREIDLLMEKRINDAARDVLDL